MPINPYDLEVLGAQGLWDYGDLKSGMNHITRGPVQQTVTPNFGLMFAKKKYADATDEAGRKAASLMGEYYRSQGANIDPNNQYSYSDIMRMIVPGQYGGHMPNGTMAFMDEPTTREYGVTYQPPVEVRSALSAPQTDYQGGYTPPPAPTPVVGTAGAFLEPVLGMAGSQEYDRIMSLVQRLMAAAGRFRAVGL